MINLPTPSLFASLKVARQNVVNVLNKYSEVELKKIPNGFGNNILWNAGHLLTAQQLLCYANSGLALRIPDTYLPLFRKGSSPKEWTENIDLDQLKALLLSTIPAMENDYSEGVFKTYNAYPTSFGVTLNNVEDAILFDSMHEGMHIGIIKSLQKLL